MMNPTALAVGEDRNRNLRRLWSVITSLLVLAVLMEAVFAGAMLSGVGSARAAHSVTAATLIVATLTAGLFALVTLRRIPRGLKLGVTLLSLAAAIFLQAMVGALSAKGTNVLWLHVPLGVALFGFAVRGASSARGLRWDDARGGT